MKNFTQIMQQMRTFMLLVVALLATTTSAVAQGSGTKADPYIMQDGGEYPFAVYKDFFGQFIVPEDVTKEGVVLELLADNWTDVYTDAELNNCVSVVSGNFAPYTTTVKIPVGTAKGTIYYVHSDFPMNSGSVKVTYGGGTPLELGKVIPAAGSVLSAAECNIGFEFTKAVRFSACTMIVGDYKAEIEAHSVDRFVSIEPKDQLMEAYRNGMLKKGDEVLFVLKGVTTLDGATSLGDVPVSYVAAAKPVVLSSSVNTPESGFTAIKSWMPLNSNEGLVKLSFDGALNKEAKVVATLSYGNSESEDPGEYYQENLVVDFEGDSTLVVDLRGKLRTPQSMVASGTNYGTMLLTVRGIEDADGYYTYAAGQGTSGAFFFDYVYEVVNYSLFTEFTPASGCSIDDVKSIELWMQEVGGKLSYEGVDFEYTFEGETKVVSVAAANILSEVDPEDETALCLTIPVPTFSRDADTQVKLTFKNVATPDGMDYSADLTAVYTTKGFTDPSGINGVTMDAKSAAIFTLEGKRIQSSQVKNNTIYVVAGKKILIK